MTDSRASLAFIRKQVAALLSEIDTSALPRPDKQRGPRDQHPGCEWSPRKGWRLFTIETGDSAGMVYLDHGCDDIRYGWPPGSPACCRRCATVATTAWTPCSTCARARSLSCVRRRASWATT